MNVAQSVCRTVKFRANFSKMNKRSQTNLHHYFDQHVCVSFRPPPSSVTKIFFSLKSSWNHPLTPGVDPGVDPGSSGARSPSGGATKGPKGPF